MILLSEASCAAGAPVDDYPPAVTEALAKTPSATLTTHVMHLGYDALSAEEALRRIIPPGIVIPVGFETVGRVAHLNLREEHEPYKAAVAAVLVDKLKQIEVVVNKTGETGGPYRTFDMEVLAGAPKNDSTERAVGDGGERKRAAVQARLSRDVLELAARHGAPKARGLVLPRTTSSSICARASARSRC